MRKNLPENKENNRTDRISTTLIGHMLSLFQPVAMQLSIYIIKF